jgi:hypothetical protein
MARKVVKVALAIALLCLGGTMILILAIGVDFHFMGISFP